MNLISPNIKSGICRIWFEDVHSSFWALVMPTLSTFRLPHPAFYGLRSEPLFD